MKDKRLNKLIKITLLAVIAFLLQFFELVIPFFPEFLKIDFSDLPALMGAFAFGPIQGVLIQLVKNILHGIFVGKTAFVGELANFMVGSVLVLASGYIYRLKKTKANAVFSLVFGVIAMSAAAGLFNMYLFLPLYEKVLGFPMKAIIGMGTAVNPKITTLNSFILLAIVPFNIIKGVVVSIITMAVYKSVSPVLHQESNEQEKAVKSMQ